MHIALFSPGWPIEKFQNGIVTYVHWLKPELESLGHRVSIFSGGIASSDYSNVHAIRHGSVGQWGRQYLKRLFPFEKDVFKFGNAIARTILDVHRRDPIDVIEIEESFGWFAAVAKLTKIPLVVKLHGPAFLSQIDEELTTQLGLARIKNEGLALLTSRAVAAPCVTTLSQTLEKYGARPAIRAQIHNPLAMDDDIPQWQLKECDPNTLLFVGRFDKRKGADIMLLAFRLLLKTRPELKLIFVGPNVGIRQQDGSRLDLNAFCNAIFSSSQRDSVKFLGPLPNRDIVNLRTKAMVTVVASRWENPGYTALEAMYQCCPIVCSDAGGCPEIIDHGRTGLLARSEDIQDYADKIATLLGSPDLAVSMGLAARTSVIENNSARNVAMNSLQLYERVIADHFAYRSAG